MKDRAARSVSGAPGVVGRILLARAAAREVRHHAAGGEAHAVARLHPGEGLRIGRLHHLERGALERLSQHAAVERDVVADEDPAGDPNDLKMAALLQQLIAGMVAQRIVDVFEQIQVDEQDGDAVAAIRGVDDEQAQRLVKLQTVRQASQRIVMGHVGDLLLDGLRKRLRLALSQLGREAVVLEEALQLTRGHKGKTCQLLGISRPTLERKLQKYGVGASQPE
mgnify:CR=1 FL=1